MINDITFNILNEEKMKLEQEEKKFLAEIIKKNFRQNKEETVHNTYCLKVIEKKLDVVRKLHGMYIDENYISRPDTTTISLNIISKPILKIEKIIEVVENPEMANKLVNLLTGYGNASRRQENIKGDLEISENLPPVFYEVLTSKNYFYNAQTGVLKSPEELLTVIENYKSKFSEAKAIYDEEFTIAKLGPLPYLEELEDINSFVKLHMNKLEKIDLVSLEQEDSNMIREKIKNRIWTWYQEYSKSILGIKHSLSLEDIATSLELQKEDISLSLIAIDEMGYRILMCQKKMLKEKAEMEQIKKVYEKQINDLTEGKITPNSFYISSDRNENLKSLLNIFLSEYEKELNLRISIKRLESLEKTPKNMPIRKRMIDEIKPSLKDEQA